MELTTYVSHILHPTNTSAQYVHQRQSQLIVMTVVWAQWNLGHLHHVHGLFYGVKWFGLQYLPTHQKTGLNKILETFLYYSIYFTQYSAISDESVSIRPSSCWMNIIRLWYHVKCRRSYSCNILMIKTLKTMPFSKKYILIIVSHN